MALEQTQKTRVESQQFSGNWAQYAVPPGSTGNATEPYYSKSEGIDLTPLGKGLEAGAKEAYPSNVGRVGSSGSGGGKEPDLSGQWLEEAWEITERNTDENGVLNSRGEEELRIHRQKMVSEGASDSDMIRVYNFIGQDYGHTLQGRLQEQERQTIVENKKKKQDKALELHPSMVGSTPEQLEEVGNYYYQSYNTAAASLESVVNPNAPQSVKDAAVKEIVDILPTLLPEGLYDRLLNEQVNAQDELDVSNAITQSLILSGIQTNPRVARQIGIELSASFIGQAREHRANIEKLELEEKKRYTDIAVQDARLGLYQHDPNKFYAAALLDFDPNKYPDMMIDTVTKNFDASKFVMANGTRYMQGAFDANTASTACQYGTPLTCNAGLEAMAKEGVRRNDAQSPLEVINAMMNPNAEGYLNKQGMQNREAAVQRLTPYYASLMAQQLRGMVSSSTPYIPGEGRVVDTGVFSNNAEGPNSIISKWNEALRFNGWSDKEAIEVGKEAMSSLGVAIPTDTTNPEVFAQESVASIRQWAEEQDKIPETSEAFMEVEGLLEAYKNGDMTEDEALARMAAVMQDSGIQANAEREDMQEEPQEGIRQTPTGTFNMSEIENQVLSSKEYRDAVNVLAKDDSITREQKSEAAQIVFRNLLDKAVGAAKELVGIKSANANVVTEEDLNKIAEDQKQRKESLAQKSLNIINELIGIKKANAHEAGYELTKLNEMSPAMEKIHSKGSNFVVYKDTEGHNTIGPGVLLDKEARAYFARKGYKPYLGHQIPKELVNAYSRKRYEEKESLSKRQFKSRGLEKKDVPETLWCIANDLGYIGKPVIGFFDKAANFVKADTPEEKEQCRAIIKEHIIEHVSNNEDRAKRLLKLADSME